MLVDQEKKVQDLTYKLEIVSKKGGMFTMNLVTNRTTNSKCSEYLNET